jgi:Xaa-Pro aminopeptidase
METAVTKPACDRAQVLEASLKEAGINLLVCTLPINVLLTTGYWPIVGPAISLVTGEGEVLLVVPEDDSELAQTSWADRVITIAPASLQELNTIDDAVRQPLWEAISPRLHPASDDILEAGMVFNIEPAICIEGLGGIRHCDMVAVTEQGAELLTPVQSEVKNLILS